MDFALIAFGLGVGILVGMTGIGGGSLMRARRAREAERAAAMARAESAPKRPEPTAASP